MPSDAPTLPLSLALSGIRCLVVGGRQRATAKVLILVEAGAAVTVIARNVDIEISTSRVQKVEQRPYRAGEAANYQLVIAATGVSDVDGEVAKDAQSAGVFVNVVDGRDASTAIFPAIFRRGHLSVAVSSDGKSPAFATWLRDSLAKTAGDDIGDLLDLVADIRLTLQNNGKATEGRPWGSFIDAIVDAYRQDNPTAAREIAEHYKTQWLKKTRAISNSLASVDRDHKYCAANFASVSIKGIDPERVPRHVACVMDGNGRWAKQRNLARTAGHAAGEEALLDAIYGALDVGISWFSVYAFSTENWRRPIDEVRFLLRFNEGILTRHRDALHKDGVRIRFAGRSDRRVPKRLVRQMDEAMELTKGNRLLTLTICFNYGGRAEIVDAVRSLVRDGVAADKINEREIGQRLYFPDMPDPDLVMRTSGEYRISNFLLWELAYSELYFTDVLWPEFRREHLFEAVREFQRRDRRFGGVSK